MCQASIAKILKVGKDKLIVEQGGKRLELKSRLQDVAKGDYVLFSSGIAVDKIDKEEAEMIGGSGC
ncbi:HupF/HypC family protein [uncultured archaeon]|nr:HupF/HypC family protein [uncultured archaeon]